jgi:hypothetical protein
MYVYIQIYIYNTLIFTFIVSYINTAAETSIEATNKMSLSALIARKKNALRMSFQAIDKGRYVFVWFFSLLMPYWLVYVLHVEDRFF